MTSWGPDLASWTFKGWSGLGWWIFFRVIWLLEVEYREMVFVFSDLFACYVQIVNGTKKERKEVLLEEHDPIWVEMRDLFIADVCTTYFLFFICTIILNIGCFKK